MTSSATAAPSTVRASTVARARRSPKTRARDPDARRGERGADEERLVGADRRAGSRRHGADAKGTITPTTATESDARPTAAELAEVHLEADVEQEQDHAELAEDAQDLVAVPTRPSTDGPIRMPATISPTTAGNPMRSGDLGRDLGGDQDDQDVEQRAQRHRSRSP